jgi:glycosyltransferase involved in cell wall biosynthesis
LNQSPGRPATQTLLFLTSGPYFWVNQRTARLRYELLSKDFDGYILSFVSRKEWRRATIGRFELFGCRVSSRVHSIPPLRLALRAVFTVVMGLYLHLFRKRLDVIITYDPFVTGLLGYILSLLTGAKLVVEVNNDFANPDNWRETGEKKGPGVKAAAALRIAAFVMSRSDRVKLLFPTQVASFYRPRSPEQIAVFHDFVPTSLFSPRVPQAPYILFVGHPWWIKGVDLLISAFTAVAEEFPQYTLQLVGQLADYPHRNQGCPRVRFVGPLMPDDVIEWVTGCSLMVLASRSEAMGRTLIEAMAAAKPVIAPRVGGIPHYIKHGETGLLFTKEDLNALTEAMRSVMADSGLAARLGRNASDLVRTRLSECCYVEAMHTMITHIRSA